MTKLAQEQADELDLTSLDLVELAKKAPLRSSATTKGVNCYVDGLMILINEDDPNMTYVISVLERESPIQVGNVAPIGSRPATSRMKAKSGGAGRRMPSNNRELIDMMKEHGFTTSVTGSGHIRVSHPDFEDVTFPNTPSDVRSLKNAIAFLKRHTGIDITRKDS